MSAAATDNQNLQIHEQLRIGLVTLRYGLSHAAWSACRALGLMTQRHLSLSSVASQAQKTDIDTFINNMETDMSAGSCNLEREDLFK